MGRVIALTALGLGAASYFPDYRQALMEVAEPLYAPAIHWNAEQEMAQVGRNVIEHEQRTGKLPDGRGWLPWLQYRYETDDLRTDPWGSVYQLRVWPDSIAIVSSGPDLTPHTEHDFQVVMPRQRSRS